MNDNHQIKIEKGVPIPSPKANIIRYPVDKMKVGDSFVIPIEGTMHVAGQLNYKHGPKRFTARKISPTQRRIWRIA